MTSTGVALNIEDLDIDEEGRVIVREVAVADWLTAAIRAQGEPAVVAAPPNNCRGGNCVRGCT